MESKNQPCLVLQFHPNTKEIIGIELTNTYNYWEKEAFIDINKRQLFPYKMNGIRYGCFERWFANISLHLITDEVNNILKPIKNNFPKILYPGYD